MIIQYTQKIRRYVYALLFCVSPFSFATPVLNIDDRIMLYEAQLQHDYYYKGHNAAAYIYAFAGSDSFQMAEQYHNLIATKAIEETSKHMINEDFLYAFKQLNISTSKEINFLLMAFASPIYQASPNLKLLVSLYHSMIYGSSVQTTMQSNHQWNMENSLLSFLGNFVGYYALKGKPHIQVFLKNIYMNNGYPALYNPPHSYFFSSLAAVYSEDYWEDAGGELGHVLLRGLSCGFNGEELRNTVGFMESCKVSKHSDYEDLANLKANGTYLLESEDTTGLSKMQLTPVPGYIKEFTAQEVSPEKYSYQSLHHVMSRVVGDKTEGALFFVLYRGTDKYQFFTAGIYQEYLSLSFVVDHHAPTPVLSYLIPLQGINLDQITDAIHAMLHQDMSNRNMVPDLQGVWMISSQQAE